MPSRRSVAVLAAGGERSGRDEVVEGTTSARMKPRSMSEWIVARRLLRARAAADGPGAALVLAGGEERDEAEQRVRGADHAVEAGLGEAEVVAEGRGVLGGELTPSRASIGADTGHSA